MGSSISTYMNQLFYHHTNLTKNVKYETSHHALITAVMNSDVEEVKKLIDVGTVLDAKSDFGETALRYSCLFNKSKIVDILVNAGANCNAKNFSNDTCLIAACRNGNTDIITKLINAGASVECKNNVGTTPLLAYFAYIKYNYDIDHDYKIDLQILKNIILLSENELKNNPIKMDHIHSIINPNVNLDEEYINILEGNGCTKKIKSARNI